MCLPLSPALTAATGLAAALLALCLPEAPSVYEVASVTVVGALALLAGHAWGAAVLSIATVPLFGQLLALPLVEGEASLLVSLTTLACAICAVPAALALPRVLPDLIALLLGPTTALVRRTALHSAGALLSMWVALPWLTADEPVPEPTASVEELPAREPMLASVARGRAGAPTPAALVPPVVLPTSPPAEFPATIDLPCGDGGELSDACATLAATTLRSGPDDASGPPHDPADRPVPAAATAATGADSGYGQVVSASRKAVAATGTAEGATGTAEGATGTAEGATGTAEGATGTAEGGPAGTAAGSPVESDLRPGDREPEVERPGSRRSPADLR
jgi:hypothetical protein